MRTGLVRRTSPLAKRMLAESNHRGKGDKKGPPEKRNWVRGCARVFCLETGKVRMTGNQDPARRDALPMPCLLYLLLDFSLAQCCAHLFCFARRDPLKSASLHSKDRDWRRESYERVAAMKRRLTSRSCKGDCWKTRVSVSLDI